MNILTRFFVLVSPHTQLALICPLRQAEKLGKRGILFIKHSTKTPKDEFVFNGSKS